MKKILTAGVALCLTLGVTAQGASFYVDANYDGLNGFLGTATAPYNTLSAAASAFVANPGSTVYVANGNYTSTLNGGLENFGTTGYNLSNVSGSWMGGYVGWTGGGSANWSTRTLPTESVSSPTSTTVINLANANSRAFVWSGATSMNLDGFVFENSDVTQSSYNGGALYFKTANYSPGTVKNSVFRNNKTTGNGGGLYLASRGSHSKLTFIGNTAANGGGAAMSGNDPHTINDSVFKNNVATTKGGGLLIGGEGGSGIFSSGYTLNRAVFEGNSAGTRGGAIDFGAAGSPTTLKRSILRNNSAPQGSAIGAGVSDNRNALTLENSLVTGNAGGGYALYSIGRYNDGASITVRYSTVADNPGGGIYMERLSGANTTTMNLDVRGTIVANNGAYGLRLVGWSNGNNGTVTLTYNDVFGHTTANYSGASAGVGSLSLDPLFIYPGNDYRLLHSTPLVNKAFWTSGYPTVDLLNDPRVTGDGFVTMGAYELTVPEPGTLGLMLLGALVLAAPWRRSGGRALVSRPA